MPASVGPTAGHLARTYYERVLNDRRLEMLDELFSASIVFHPGGGVALVGIETFRKWVADFLAAVPDYRLEVLEVIDGEGSAAVRWTCHGTHDAPLFGLPPTGRRFDFDGIAMFHAANGRIVEGWVQRDLAAIQRQLRANPTASTK